MDVSCVDRLSSALAFVAQQPPAVVVLDLTLPDSHGPETFRRLHEQAPSVPVVILTAVDDEEIAVKAVQLGAQDYLLKGQVDGKQLARSIRYAVERQALLTSLENQPPAAVTVQGRIFVARFPRNAHTADFHLSVHQHFV